ncbi:MAG: rRNA processing protein RimM [Frankiales bacterium]|nr:rRNA processing protein RimM [Frankiales bacterium]
MEAPVEPTLLVVGRIGRPQGLLGEVTIEVRTDDPDLRFAAGTRLVTEPPERGPLTIATARDHSGRLILSFEGITSRTAAETLRDTLLQVDAATLPPPDDPDVFHDFQLVGLAARLADGTVLGTVAEVLHLPHGDVLAIRRQGAPELLVPFVRAMVPVVDVAAGHVVIEPPEGLLDLAGVDAEPEPEPAGDEPDRDAAGPGHSPDQD